MDVQHCGLGAQVPVFDLPSDIEAIRERLFRTGIAFIRDSGIDSLVMLGTNLGTVIRPRNEQHPGTGISNIRYAPSLRGKGYSSEELFLHTDRSGWDQPPRVLISTLQKKSKVGGESIFVDTKLVIQTIKNQNPSLYSFITSSKHTSFRTEDGNFVLRPIYDEQSDLFRFRFDDGIQFSASVILRVSELLEVMSRCAFHVSLEPGQGYVVDNHRFLHGRTAFTGSRELLRVLVNIPTTRPRKVILFDVDGTLCSSHDLSVDAYFSCLSSLTGKSITLSNTHVNLNGRTDLGLLHAILDYHQITPKSTVVEKFLRLHPKYVEMSLRKGMSVTPCPRVKEFLQWIGEQKNKLDQPGPIFGILTGNSRANTLAKLYAAGIDSSVFDLDISSFGDTHFDRVSLVQSSLAKIRATYSPDQRPNHVVIVGDTPLDIECAKHSGCLVISVATGNYGTDDLAALGPDLVCDELSESKEFLLSNVF
ncbi:Clavaminate synthase-like protein [Aspergillus ambiguus]|uniref:Clavaminate synthase-like protein n=1 Tax=Aspergillus ambiguus TaxID=176160 RepID=UPI003CCD0A1E